MTINTPGSRWDNLNLHALNIVNQNTSSEIWRTIWREYTITSYLGENPDREILISAIKSAIELIKREDIYASWSEWEIYRIKIADTKGHTRELLVAKKRFDNNPDNEYTLHDRIGRLVKEWDPVKVPVLRWKFSHEGDEYIVMDFIKWKTLYHKIAEWIIEAEARQIESNATWKTETEKNIASSKAFNLRHQIKSAKSDSDVDSIFLKWYKYDSQKADEAFDREKLKVQIFWSEEWKKIIKDLWDFIKKMHKAWFYHRDLHEKNIIFWDDGKIYVIDFWKTFFKDPKEWGPSDIQVYDVDIWEQERSYIKDEEILGIINNITKTKEQEEWEAFSQQLRERAQELTKGTMVIQLVDFKKIKSKKILNLIKKYFGWFEQFKRELEKEGKSQIKITSLTWWIEDYDLLILLFSQTKENLDYLLNTEIPQRKSIELGKLRQKWIDKYSSDDWDENFENPNNNIDEKINKLKDFTDKMRKKESDYEKYYSKMNFLGELKPFMNSIKELIEIQKVETYLNAIYNAIK